MLFQSILSALLVVQTVYSSPAERASGKITCSKDTVRPGPLVIAYPGGGGLPAYPVVKHTSSAGQHQLSLSENRNANPIQAIVRQCNSSRLGLHHNEEHDSYPVKLFLASDESKCLQRHADLHSNDPTATTHLVIAECSNVDDSNQAKQFWNRYSPVGPMVPLVVTDGEVLDTYIVLSETSYSGQLLATLQYPTSTSNRAGYALYQEEPNFT